MLGAPNGYPIASVLDSGNRGALNVTLDDATLNATATLALTANLSVLLDDASLVATSILEIHAVEGTQLDDCTLVARSKTSPRIRLALGRSTGRRRGNAVSSGAPVAHITSTGRPLASIAGRGST